MDWKQLENHPNTWKWVWLVSLIFFVITLISSITDMCINSGIIISALFVVSLYGIAYKKPIWYQKIWKILFWFNIILIVIVGTLLLMSMINSTGNTEQIESSNEIPLALRALGIALVTFFIIELRGLYLYAFQRPNIWSKSNEPD